MGSMQVSKLFIGPDLYKVTGSNYQCTTPEYWARCALSCAGVIKALATFFSPFIIFHLYRRDFFISTEPTIRWMVYIGTFYMCCYTLKAIGRVFDPTYKQFLRELDVLHSNPSPAVRRAFTLKYDCHTSGLPFSYEWQNQLSGDTIQKRRYLPPKADYWYPQNPLGQKLLDGACYLAAHSLGISMMYPGCTALINALVQSPLLDGRIKLMRDHNGMRYKLKSGMNDSIDCMFVDKRNKTSNGNTLVITCEGNAGFYEVGSTTTSVQCGYSVLGWNHPGFAGSEGAPYPPRDAAAVDVVVQFATTKLGFLESDIVIYGWSIGGFPASYAAMNHPNLKGVILDATFDDVSALAVQQFPKSIDYLTLTCTRTQLDLPVSRQLVEYPGPILLIRRSKDEIICTERETDSQKLRTNRSNQLLIELLRARYPSLMAHEPESTNALQSFMFAGTSDDDEDTPSDASEGNHSPYELARASLLSQIDHQWCGSRLRDYENLDLDKQSSIFPSSIGEDLTSEQRRQLLIYLAHWYMIDFDSIHNNPLPAELFRVPRLPGHED